MTLLGVTGSVASIIGLVVTVYVAWAIRKLRQRYVRQAIYTECLANLQAHLRNLKTARTRKKVSDIRERLGRIQEILGRIAIHDLEQSSVEWPIGEIDRILESRDLEIAVDVAEVIPQVGQRIEKLELMLLELQWGKDDGQ